MGEEKATVPAVVKRRAPAKRRTTDLAALKGHVVNQKRLREFVKKSLVEGRDYGVAYEGSDRQAIYKAGCESVYIYLNLIPKYFQDRTSWEMAGAPPQIHFENCYLVPTQWMGKIYQRIRSYGVDNEEIAYREFAVSMGRGAADIREGQIKNYNNAVKKAKIRALKDAVLGLGLSGYFQQDVGLEDDSTEYSVPPKQNGAPAEPQPKPEAKAKISEVFEEIAQILAKYPFKGAVRQMWEAKAEMQFNGNNLAALQSVRATLMAQAKHMKGAADGQGSR